MKSVGFYFHIYLKINMGGSHVDGMSDKPSLLLRTYTIRWRLHFTYTFSKSYYAHEYIKNYITTIVKTSRSPWHEETFKIGT